MKFSIQSLAILLTAGVSAQITVVNDPMDTGIVTSYYSVCPTATSTTITLPSTTTICPGGVCGYPIITAVPTPITIMGQDGRETIFNIETTILPHLCQGGVCGATYTISEECPCTAGPKTVTIDSCPAGFTTTVVECHVCAANGGPSTVTLTTPMSNGPYATVIPAMGSPVNNPAAITTAPAAGNNGGSGTGSGTGSGASSGSGSGSGTGSGSGSGSNAGSPAAAAAPNSGNAQPAAGNAASPAANTPVTPAKGAAWSSGSMSKNVTNPTGGMTAISPAISPYMGAASKATMGPSTILTGMIGLLACLL